MTLQGWLPNIGKAPSFSGKIREYRRHASRQDSNSYERNVANLSKLMANIRADFPKARIHLRPPFVENSSGRRLPSSKFEFFSPLFEQSATYIDLSDALDDTSFVDGNHINASSVLLHSIQKTACRSMLFNNHGSRLPAGVFGLY